MRALIAEDQPFSRAVLSALLSQQGCDVDTFETGAEAVEALCKAEYALALVDCNLPDMTGYSVVENFRNKGERQPTIIYGISATNDNGIAERCQRSGMDGFFSKPVDQKLLLELVSKLAQPEHNGTPCSAAAAEQKFDSEFSADYYRSFLQSCRDDLAHIETMLARHRWHEVRDFAHRMKGVAAFANCHAVLHSAMNLEVAAGEGNLRACEEHKASIAKALDNLEGNIARGQYCCE